MADHALGSFIEFPSVILLFFQRDTKLIVFTDKNSSKTAVSLFAEENANHFSNIAAICVAQIYLPTAHEAVLACQPM